MAYIDKAKTVEWTTPQPLFDYLNGRYHFTLDPASTHENAKCEKHYTLADNGLLLPWGGSVFCNPPYGRELPVWVEKAYMESLDGSLVVMLIPARTDTRIWHDLIFPNATVAFMRGRVHFGQAGPAPFPTALIRFGGEYEGITYGDYPRE